jgi:hypothetical protein
VTNELTPYRGFEPVPPGHRLPTKAECIAAAAQAQADAIHRLSTRDPREAAVAAHVPGGPSVAELEARIRDWQSRYRDDPTDTSPPTG